MKYKKEGMKSTIDLNEYASQKGLTVDLKIVRERIAGILAVLVGLACLFLATVPLCIPERTVYVKDVLPIFTTLLGTAFGFYFSQERLRV